MGFWDLIFKFLSTPSARRATATGAYCSAKADDFYPRPPRGGRQIPFGDADCIPQFLSTPSARRATLSTRDFAAGKQISIHALREEGDLTAGMPGF